MLRRTVPTIAATAAVAAMGVALLAGACGAPAASPDVASLGEPAAAGTTTTTAVSRDPKEAALEFARCMREHGVDIPDPEFDESGGGVGITIGGGPGSVDGPALEAAHKACEPIMESAVPDGERKLDPAEEARMREDALKFAQCMREHGVDMPDPTFEGNGKVTSRLAGPEHGGPAPASPVFEEAHEACKEHMGGRSLVRRGGPGDGGSDR